MKRRLHSGEIDAILERLVSPTFVDPGQVTWQQPTAEDSPERRLQRAILFDAVQCVLRHRDSSLPNQRREARSAARWIESPDETYFLSFVPICQRLGIEPEWIRRLLRPGRGRRPLVVREAA